MKQRLGFKRNMNVLGPPSKCTYPEEKGETGQREGSRHNMKMFGYPSYRARRNQQTFSWSLPVLVWMSLLLLILPQATKSQQAASIVDVPLFTTNKTLSKRQSVCDRAHKYDSGSRHNESLHLALEGLQLTVAARPGLYFIYEDGQINEEYPGLMALFLDEIAKRGRFSWRDSFAVYDGPGVNGTWDKLALFQTEFFDVAADWWTESLERMKVGISFPEGWYDASFILVSSKGEASLGAVKMLNWTLPFEPEVWIMIVFTLLWSGLVYMFLEYLAFPGQYTGRRARESFGNDIFLSMLLFTQHFQFTPKTPASRIFATSMAFWALLISSAYTANLASFFVDETQQSYSAASLEEAVRWGKPICVWDSTPQAIHVQQQYPLGLYVKKKDEKDLYLAVDSGECALAVTTMTSYRDHIRKKEINPDCALDWVGAPIKPSMAGFATKTDSGRKCTSLIDDVMNLHLLEMKIDGTLEKMWDEHFGRNLDHFCDAPTQEKEQSQRRNLHEMGGTFAFHFMVSVIAIALAVGTKFWKVYKKRRPPPTSRDQKSVSWSQMDKTVEMKYEDSDGSHGGYAPTATANTGNAVKASFLKDFWGPTSQRFPSGWTSHARDMSYSNRRDSNGALNKEQLIELLQNEFQQQQSQMEERIAHKMQQQQYQMQERIEQQMQQQFGIMVDLLKQNQVGGSARTNYRPKSPSDADHFQSYRPGPLTSSVARDEESRSHQSGQSKTTQISQLLYPHEKQELNLATAEYFADDL